MYTEIFTKKLIWRAFIIICIVVTLVVPLLYYLSTSLQGKPPKFNSYLLGFLFTFLVTASISLTNLFLFRFFNNKYLNHKKYLKIFVYEFLVSSLNAAAIMTIIVIIFYFGFGQIPDENQSLISIIYSNMVVALIVNTIICGFTETYILFRHWKNSITESERLRREKAESQFAALKNQVNPHFLFNSLNTLSSLIRVSPEKAIEYVDKFSKIYRYVLDSTDKMLVELRDEINFLNSFIYLQKIRFGENLDVQLNINANYLNDYLPPLAIQMLVENAIKHNEVSTEYPLIINILIEENYLVISNNLQLKIGLEGSTGIGLKNLEARYNQFTDQKPLFYATVDKYFAKIPLIKEIE
jgi:two-component system, LytTR family, sensor kinase